MSIKHLLDLGRNGGSLLQQVSQLSRELGQDEFSGPGAGHDDGLCVQRGQDVIDNGLIGAWRPRPGHGQQPAAARCAQPGRATEPG